MEWSWRKLKPESSQLKQTASQKKEKRLLQ